MKSSNDFIIKGEKMQKKFEDLSFTDDFMFCKIMYDNEDICKEIVELLLGCRVKKVIYPEKQKSIDITADSKGIRLDVYLQDDDTVYDIEMQTTVNLDIPKRARYYQGMIDLNLIDKGAAYNELKKSYVVFICLNDIFHKNRSIYTFKSVCIEDSDIILADEATKVFVNANGCRDGLTSAQISFLDYISGKEPTDYFTERLNKVVKKAREKEEWRTEYMTLLQRDREKRAEGKLEKLVELIVRKIKKNKPVDVIADELEEDIDTVQRIYEVANEFAPDYDIDEICEKLNR